MPSLFADGYMPRPSLIHGDLWSGNWGMLEDGTPVVFDPCVSYSDREADLAMMELFGSLPAEFWRGYGAMPAGYSRRKRLYQLYHLLNHAVLFGGGYAQQVLHCARELLS
jgi:protein-ribulosamine 3-kinase